MPKEMQMRQGFTQRESHLVGIHLAFEQDVQGCCSAQPVCGASPCQVFKAFCVVVSKLNDALV